MHKCEIVTDESFLCIFIATPTEGSTSTSAFFQRPPLSQPTLIQSHISVTTLQSGLTKRRQRLRTFAGSEDRLKDAANVITSSQTR